MTTESRRSNLLGAVGLAAVLSIGGGVPAAADEISVAASEVAVIDGDTIEVGGRALDLSGLDAPEFGQLCRDGAHLWTCGRDAAYALRKLIAVQAQPVVCRTTASGGGVEQAVCEAGGKDIGETMAAAGQTTVRNDVPASLKAAERRARDAGVGIWRGEFVPPSEWRQGARLPAEDAAEKSTAAWEGFPYTVLGVRILPVPRVHYAGKADRGIAGTEPSGDRLVAVRTLPGGDRAD